MHTFTFGGATIRYNSDGSGNAYVRGSRDKHETRIDCRALIAFVAELNARRFDFGEDSPEPLTLDALAERVAELERRTRHTPPDVVAINEVLGVIEARLARLEAGRG